LKPKAQKKRLSEKKMPILGGLLALHTSSPPFEKGGRKL
jgi:hypothetical protein